MSEPTSESLARMRETQKIHADLIARKPTPTTDDAKIKAFLAVVQQAAPCSMVQLPQGISMEELLLYMKAQRLPLPMVFSRDKRPVKPGYFAAQLDGGQTTIVLVVEGWTQAGTDPLSLRARVTHSAGLVYYLFGNAVPDAITADEGIEWGDEIPVPEVAK